MRTLKIFGYVLAALVFIPIFLLVVWKCWLVFRTLDANVAAAIVTAVAGVIGLSVTQELSKRREIAESHRENKIKVYNVFLDIIDRFQGAEKAGKNIVDDSKPLPKSIQKQFSELNRGFILWASPKVIKSWLRFRKNTGADNDTKFTLFYADDLLQAIRKDLGNSNFGLKQGDIIKQYLSNPDELDELKNEFRKKRN